MALYFGLNAPLFTAHCLVLLCLVSVLPNGPCSPCVPFLQTCPLLLRVFPKVGILQALGTLVGLQPGAAT